MIGLDASSLRSRIARRIFGTFVICAFIPFAGLVIVSYRQVTEFFSEKSQTQLRALAKTFGMDTYERLLLLEAALQTIAGTIESFETIPSEEQLENLASNPKARWEALALVTMGGKRHRLFGAVETFPDLTASEKAHLTSGKALLSIRAGKAGAASIFMSLASNHRSTTAIVIGEIKPGYLWNIAESRVLPAYVTPCAFEITGATLMCSSPDHAPPAELLRQVGVSAVGEFEWTVNGSAHQASYWTIPIKFEFQASEWIVMLLTSKEGIFASISDLKETFVLWTAVCVGLSLLLALCQIRRRLVPVEKLHEATRRIAQNDFDSRVEVRSADEFEELAGSFNAMAAQLGHQFKTLNTTADIQRAVLSLLDTTKIVETILGRMLAVLLCDCATLTVFNAAEETTDSTFVLRAAAAGQTQPQPASASPLDGASKRIELLSSPAAAAISRRVAEVGSPLTIREAAPDLDPQASEWFRANHFSSCLAAPLNVNGRIFGGIAFYSSSGRSFTQQDVAFVVGLTDQAAIAIYNSQLYERTRSQATELTVANRVKDEFLSVMSHELRTPINVILGYITMLQDQLLGEMNGDQLRALSTVTKHSRDLLAMIERIMDVTNLESGAFVVERNDVSLPDLIESLKSHYTAPLGKEIEIVWDCPRDLPVLKTDASKLKRILHNLVDNAVKFTPKGSVAVSLRRVRENESLIIEVRDTGIGIPAHALPMLFKKFHQLDSSATREHEGIGLGLYIVKRLADLIGAQIEVSSQPGAGTTFKVLVSSLVPDGSAALDIDGSLACG
jgi:signal transduction histidine kinase